MINEPCPVRELRRESLGGTRTGGGVKRTLAFLCAVLSPIAASAGTTEVGGAVIFVHGSHTEQAQPLPQYSQAVANLVPAPFLLLEHRAGRVTLHLESIPPLGTVPVANNALGLSGVQLSYLGGYLGYALSPRTRIFVGETIFNQQTGYAHTYGSQNVSGIYVTGSHETDRSRVAGAQYGVIETLASSARSSLVATFGVNPHLSANLAQQATYSWNDGSATQTRWFVTPEAGSQIDASLVRRVFKGRTTFAYGLRYINMTMRFADGTLADRNAFAVPFVGISTTLRR